eukprot:s436_g5.t1
MTDFELWGYSHKIATGCLSSFLPRFMGLYSLQFPKERVPAYLVVFENLFPAGLKFEAKYDLKGVLGSHGYVTAEQRASGVEVLKDRNFLERQPLRLASPELLAQMEKDVDFLEQHGRIDYSLLLICASNFHVAMGSVGLYLPQFVSSLPGDLTKS